VNGCTAWLGERRGNRKKGRIYVRGREEERDERVRSRW